MNPIRDNPLIRASQANFQRSDIIDARANQKYYDASVICFERAHLRDKRMDNMLHLMRLQLLNEQTMSSNYVETINDIKLWSLFGSYELHE